MNEAASTACWGSGNFDVFVAFIAVTEARVEEAAFSVPCYFNTMLFTALKELGLTVSTP